MGGGKPAGFILLIQVREGGGLFCKVVGVEIEISKFGI